jgi:hypothetical protein
MASRLLLGLNRKTVFITGASRGIGEAIAIRYALTLHDIRYMIAQPTLLIGLCCCRLVGWLVVSLLSMVKLCS